MDPQDPRNSSNNPTPPQGESPAPETPPEGQPGVPQSAPPPQQPPPQQPYFPPPPPTGAYPAQTTPQPAWPPYPQGGQEGYPQQSQPYSAPYQPPMPDQPPPGGYMPDGTPAPPMPGAQGGYYPPDYRPPSPGGYSSHEQPTQAYGQGPGQGGYQGYPGYPPQQGGTQQYNVNAPKKGMPIWVWGVIGLLVIALVGGGLFFFVFNTKSNAPAVSNTPQPTVAAGQPTTIPGQPTTATRQPTPVPPTPTVSRNTPVPTTAVRPTSVTPATRVPTIARTTVEPRPTTVPGQGGFVGTPRDATIAFFNYLRDSDYASAHALIAPEIAPFLDADLLEQVWGPMQALMVGDVQVGEASESGDSATVPIDIPLLGGASQKLSVELRKDGDRWYIVNPFLADIESIPTFEPIEIPTLVP